jgi:hypothetical protein
MVVVVVNPSSSLIVRYKFDDPDDLGKDSSTYGNHGTVVGTIWDGSESSGCITNFPGGNYLTGPSSIFTLLDKEVTVTVWAKNTSSLEYQFTVLFYGGPNDRNKFNVHLPYQQTIYWDCTYNVNRIYRLSPAADNEWTPAAGWLHWGFTKNGNTGEMKVYRNGAVLFSGNGMTSSLTNIHGTLLKVGSEAGISPYTGKIDDFRLYSRELTAAEIGAIFAAGKDAP